MGRVTRPSMGVLPAESNKFASILLVARQYSIKRGSPRCRKGAPRLKVGVALEGGQECLALGQNNIFHFYRKWFWSTCQLSQLQSYPNRAGVSGRVVGYQFDRIE